MSGALCAVVSGCSSPQPQTQEQVQAPQPTAAASVTVSAPAKVGRPKVGEGNAVTVDFIYPPGEQHWTDEAKAALHEAADALLADIEAPKPVTISYKLGTDENPDNLAQASSDRVNLESPGYFRTVVQQKLITGFNTAFEPNLTGGDGGLFFGGPNAMAAYDGKPVPLLTDSPWSVSNIAHLNGHVFTDENRKVMNSGNEATDGPETHVLSPVELGILEDLGYTVVQH
ncbi:MAG: hypothetical protein HY239_04195 [Mycolicibacterium aromaticivorans]|nr:hypothetical protein [Mycolicibacterium aromaticivorans]